MALFATLIGAALRIAWLRAIPDGGAPDEPQHRAFVTFLATYARIPRAADIFAPGASAYAMTSPIPYLPSALLARFFGDSLFVVRLGSVVFGVLFVWVVARVAAELFPDRPLLVWSLPMFAAIHPQLVFVHSYVNADSYTTLACAISVALWPRTLRGELDSGLAVRHGLAAAVVMLGKLNGFAVILVTAAVFAIAIARGPRPEKMKLAALAAAVALVLSGWLFALNWWRLGGDIFGARTMFELFHRWPGAPPSPASQGVTIFGLWLRTSFIPVSFQSAWLVLGWMDGYLPRTLYWPPVIFSVLGAVGVFRASLTHRFSLPLALICMSTCVVAFALLSWTSLVNDFQPQGRYLFPAFVPAAVLMLAGLADLGAPQRLVGRILVSVTLCYTALIHLYGFLVLLPGHFG